MVAVTRSQKKQKKNDLLKILCEINNNKNNSSHEIKCGLVKRLYIFLSENMEEVSRTIPGLYETAKDKLLELTVCEQWTEGSMFYESFDIGFRELLEYVHHKQS